MASDADDSQKTEEPTAKKLADARQRGDVSVSREIVNLAAILLLTLSIALFVPFIFKDLVQKTTYFIEFAHVIQFDMQSLKDTFHVLLAHMAFWVLPFGVGSMLILIFANLSQNGLILSSEALALKFNRINPVTGFKQMMSLRRLVELAKDVFKLIFLFSIGGALVMSILSYIDVTADFSASGILDDIYQWILLMLLGSLILMVPVAILDFTFQKLQHIKKLRMTKQEVKDEHKQTEGDPEVKARIRRIRHERHSKRMMQNVPTADVVITNPTHYAIALAYDPESMEAPKVVAKGQDLIAMRIRQIAEENNVAIYSDPPLARALYATVEIEQEIPEAHYLAVAEIIRYVFQLKGKTLPSAA